MQDDVKAVELAPCLCGQEAHLFRFYSRPGEEGAHITIDCAGFASDECPLNMMLSIDVTCQADVDAAIAAWNNRAALAALQERCERLEAELRLWRALVQEGGVPRYAVIPGAALNTVVTSTDSLLTPDSSGAYSMAPEDTDPKLDRG